MLPLTVTQTLTSSVAPEELWRAFEAVIRWPETMRSLRKVLPEPDKPLAVGSIIRSVSESGAKRNERVMQVEPPHRLVLVIDDEDYRSRTEYRIEQHESDTEVTVTGSLEARGLGQTVRFLLWRERMTPMLKATLCERAQAIIDLAERMRAER
jgi:polyketide cyclase/dehydrase/lipid transport protein